MAAARPSRRVLYKGPTQVAPRLFRFAIANGRESIQAMISNPQDRTPAVEAAVRQVGGTLQHAWVTLSHHDTVVVAELPDEVAANALWNAFKAGAGVERISMEPLITLQDHVRALKLAAKVDYTPPQGQTWDRSATGSAPKPGSREVVYRPRDDLRSVLFKVELLNCNPDSIRAMMVAPHDRTPAVEATLNQVSGKLHHAWVTLSQYDTVMIVELPDAIAANALYSVFKAGGGVVELEMEPVMTLADHVEALKVAARIDYTPPQGRTSGSRRDAGERR